MTAREASGEVSDRVVVLVFGARRIPRALTDLTAVTVPSQSDLTIPDGTARVIDQEGIDRSAEFLRGAEMVLAIARLQQVGLSYGKTRALEDVDLAPGRADNIDIVCQPRPYRGA